MADWSERGDYIAKRGLTPEHADEALADPIAVVMDPDPASLSGRSVRTIGYSHTADAVLTVITVEDEGIVYGANAWIANDRDRRTYEERSTE